MEVLRLMTTMNIYSKTLIIRKYYRKIMLFNFVVTYY